MKHTKSGALVESIFRHEYGKMISLLTYKFGPSNLERIEDAVQEALIKAMRVWGYKEAPQNPTAWLLRVAKNQLIDRLRKDNKMIHEDAESLFERETSVLDEVQLGDTINDSQLKMIFACCHPSLSQDYQIILSLKLIGGFGNAELARAMLKKEETIAKSFTRAKKRLKDNIKTLESPIEIGLKSRLTIVLKIIYLLFSEGYAPSSGEVLIKKDFCMEAIRLAMLLTQNKYCNQPEVHALIALMGFHTCRFEARTDEQGQLIDLEHQDRTIYDPQLLNIGIAHLEKAETYGPLSDYHLQAAVSYYHCAAKSFRETDWEAILKLYDLQLQRHYSPIVQLNRIVPFHKVFGAKKALSELRDFEKDSYYNDNALFYAIKSELLLDIKNSKGSKEALERAIELTQNELEKKHLIKKLEGYHTK